MGHALCRVAERPDLRQPSVPAVDGHCDSRGRSKRQRDLRETATYENGDGGSCPGDDALPEGHPALPERIDTGGRHVPQPIDDPGGAATVAYCRGHGDVFVPAPVQRRPATGLLVVRTVDQDAVPDRERLSTSTSR